MTDNDIRTAVLRSLTKIAPEADPATIAGNVNLRDQLDIDSMDFLNFVIALHDHFGVDIPEADYAKLSTLDACVNYFRAAQQRISP
jgi:acyl carrier protein